MLQVCVLAPEAEAVLMDIATETAATYIVGGIVDRTITKYTTLYYAQKHKMQVHSAAQYMHAYLSQLCQHVPHSFHRQACGDA